MEQVKQAILILQQGGIIIYPTDTAFGMGCLVTNEVAVDRLFSLRQREVTKATPVLVNSLKMAKDYAAVSDEVAYKLIKPYWPGALTIIIPCVNKKIPPPVSGGGKTIGLRMPNHETALHIIHGVNEGIVGCSANFAGGHTPFFQNDLDAELIKKVDYVVSGNTNGEKLTSTVINCTVEPWKIVRQGSVQIGNL